MNKTETKKGKGTTNAHVTGATKLTSGGQKQTNVECIELNIHK